MTKNRLFYDVLLYRFSNIEISNRYVTTCSQHRKWSILTVPKKVLPKKSVKDLSKLLGKAIPDSSKTNVFVFALGWWNNWKRRKKKSKTGDTTLLMPWWWVIRGPALQGDSDQNVSQVRKYNPVLSGFLCACRLYRISAEAHHSCYKLNQIRPSPNVIYQCLPTMFSCSTVLFFHSVWANWLAFLPTLTQALRDILDKNKICANLLLTCYYISNVEENRTAIWYNQRCKMYNFIWLQQFSVFALARLWVCLRW